MFSFSSSKLVDRPFDWAYQLEDLGYSGWEIVNEGRQKLTRENLAEAKRSSRPPISLSPFICPTPT